ncbi:MAG: flagellar assembly protein FliX [Rhodospirillaceae bacterium]|nr:flagellar assembly protein FliX [Rhodospirillaceae bacterium]
MKIEASAQVRRTEKNRKAGRTDGIGARFADAMTRMFGDGQGPAAVDGPGSVTGVEALLAVQAADGVDNSPQGRMRQARARAGRQLDALDLLRRDLLSGGLSQQALEELARCTGEQRAEVDDPRLVEVLDEIDLRVQVELAKLGIDVTA